MNNDHRVDACQLRACRPATTAPSLLAGLLVVTAAIILVSGRAAAEQPGAGQHVGVQAFADPTGVIATVNLNGRTDERGAFFKSLGTNGRSCATCHVVSQAMSFSSRDAQLRFARTRGQDALFAPIDGANCPNGRRASAADHSLLLKHGLIRVFRPLPANAQFSISVVYDPYGCALAPDPNGGTPVISVYRRPLPTANLAFLSAVMFDGRETKAPLNNDQTFLANLSVDLAQQAIDATTGHAQAAHDPTPDQVADIVNFELGLFSAQALDFSAGLLRMHGATGSPVDLAGQAYHPGINDSLGADPSGDTFNPTAMTLYSAWTNIHTPNGEFRQDAARRSIAAGEALFNTAPLQIANVRGLNDNPTLGNPSTFQGTCTSCHNAPNVGNHSFPLPLDIGIGHSQLPGAESDPGIAAALAELSMPDLPVFLVSGCPNPFQPGEPESFYTTDPGKALISGQCSDFNRVKGPILRGLAARAPYFHNGAAGDLSQLVNFYNQRFQMGLTGAQKRDLVAFLNSL